MRKEIDKASSESVRRKSIGDSLELKKLEKSHGFLADEGSHLHTLASQ